jgi:hypothetical protein
MFQVAVEVCGEAAVVVVMFGSFCRFNIGSIDIDTSDVEYNDGDSQSYGRAQKAYGSASCLANHA